MNLEPLPILEVNIQKTDLAKELEQVLVISFDLFQTTDYDAGYDVRACIDDSITIAPYARALIPTGLHIEMGNPYWEIEVRPRSGLAAKNGITVLNAPGTVDYNYREEIKVILFNSTAEPFVVKPGDRIAQLCFRPVPKVYFYYVDKISKTSRSGFGSSGSR